MAIVSKHFVKIQVTPLKYESYRSFLQVFWLSQIYFSRVNWERTKRELSPPLPHDDTLLFPRTCFQIWKSCTIFAQLPVSRARGLLLRSFTKKIKINSLLIFIVWTIFHYNLQGVLFFSAFGLVWEKLRRALYCIKISDHRHVRRDHRSSRQECRNMEN